MALIRQQSGRPSWLIVLALLIGPAAVALSAEEGLTRPERDPCDVDLQFNPISNVTVGLKLDPSKIPTDCSKDLFVGPQRPTAKFSSLTDFCWQPSNFFHQPLYFDDAPLERYGQSLCPHLQPVLSGARFFITLPAIPYKIGVDHTHDCVTNLGKYRARELRPCVKETLPLCDLDGALLTAGTALVMVLCLP